VYTEDGIHLIFLRCVLQAEMNHAGFSYSKIKPHPDSIFVTIFSTCYSQNLIYILVGRVLFTSYETMMATVGTDHILQLCLVY